MQSPYDEAAREAAKMFDANAFLAWLMPEVAAEYNCLPEWLDARQKKRTCDAVAGWTRKEDGSPLATVIEFLTRPRKRYLRIVARYVLDIELDVPYQKGRKGLKRVPYQAVGLILLLTGQMKRAIAGGDFRKLKLGRRRWTVPVIALSQQSAMKTLERILAGELGRCVLPWIPLMDGGDTPAVMERWREVALTEPNATFRAQYGTLALVFADAARRVTMWEVALEGWNVKDEEGPLLQRWRAASEARGEVRGEARGEAKTLARVNGELAQQLEQQLQIRFGEAAANEVRPRLANADHATLTRWLILTLQTTSWPELLTRWDAQAEQNKTS